MITKSRSASLETYSERKDNFVQTELCTSLLAEMVNKNMIRNPIGNNSPCQFLPENIKIYDLNTGSDNFKRKIELKYHDFKSAITISDSQLKLEIEGETPIVWNYSGSNVNKRNMINTINATVIDLFNNYLLNENSRQEKIEHYGSRYRI